MSLPFFQYYILQLAIRQTKLRQIDEAFSYVIRIHLSVMYFNTGFDPVWFTFGSPSPSITPHMASLWAESVFAAFESCSGIGGLLTTTNMQELCIPVDRGNPVCCSSNFDHGSLFCVPCDHLLVYHMVKIEGRVTFLFTKACFG